MHRDISIGNVLKLKTPAERKEFSIKNAKDLVEALTTGSNRDDYHRAVVEKADVLRKAANGSTEQMLVVARKILLAAENLEKAVKQLKVGSKCKAIVSDGDLAVFIPSYFQVRHGSDSIAVCSLG